MNEPGYEPIRRTGALTSGERSSIRAFVDTYRAAFEAFDVAAIAELCNDPPRPS